MVNRRTALKQMSGIAGAVVLAEGWMGKGSAETVAQPMSTNHALALAAENAAPFTLPALPYAYDALEPHFDAETMHLHHDKHHQGYVNNLNAAVKAHPELEGKSLNELVAGWASAPETARAAVRNNGGGHLNHSLWWTTLGKGGDAPKGELAKAIDAKFGTFSSFQEQFTKAAMGVFGSGWAWLVRMPDGTVTIESTPNQDSPVTAGHTPVMGVDVWEHAYYLKYQNRRADYVKAYFNVVNWDAVSGNFAQKA